MEIETGINQLKIQGLKIEIGDNDYDFVEEKPNVFNFELAIAADYKQNLQVGKFQAKKIIFANYGHSQLYLQSKVNKNKDFKKVADMNFSRQKQLFFASLYVPVSNPDLLVVIFNYQIEDKYEFKFSEYFFQFINTSILESVLILDTINQENILSAKLDRPIKTPHLFKFTTSNSVANSLFPDVTMTPFCNSFYGIKGDITTYLELQGLRGEILLITPVEQVYVFKDVQAFEILRSLYPQLNVDTTAADMKNLIQRLNDDLYNSGMFI